MTCRHSWSCKFCLARIEAQAVAQLSGMQSMHVHVLLLMHGSAIAELRLLQGAVLVSPTTALSQVFNVSHNNLTGSVPAFLASSKVPSYTKQGISLVVMLTASLQLATLPVMWLTSSETADLQPRCFSAVSVLAPVFLGQFGGFKSTLQASDDVAWHKLTCTCLDHNLDNI